MYQLKINFYYHVSKIRDIFKLEWQKLEKIIKLATMLRSLLELHNNKRI